MANISTPAAYPHFGAATTTPLDHPVFGRATGDYDGLGDVLAVIIFVVALSLWGRRHQRQ